MVALITIGIILLVLGALDFFKIMPAFLANFFDLLLKAVPENIRGYLGLGFMILGAVLIVIGLIILVVSKVQEKKSYERALNAPSRPKEVQYYSPMSLEETQAAANKVVTGSDNVLGANGTLQVQSKLGGGPSAPVMPSQGGALGGISRGNVPVDNSGLSATFLQREQEAKAEYERVQNIYKGTGSNANPLYNPNSGGLVMGGSGVSTGVGGPGFMGTTTNTQVAMQQAANTPVNDMVQVKGQDFAQMQPQMNANPLTGNAGAYGSPYGNTYGAPQNAYGMNQNQMAANPYGGTAPMMGNANPYMGQQSVNAFPGSAQMAQPQMQQVQQSQGGFVIPGNNGENPMLVNGPLGGTNGMAPVPTMNPNINMAPMGAMNQGMPQFPQSAPSPIMENLPKPPVMPSNM